MSSNEYMIIYELQNPKRNGGASPLGGAAPTSTKKGIRIQKIEKIGDRKWQLIRKNQ